MSLTTELEELLGEKAQLKEMLQSIEEEEKYLGKRLRIVEEKIEIQVLKEKIKAKRAVVEQLKSRIWNLEKRLKEPQKKEPTEVMIKEAPASQQPKQSKEQKDEQQEIKERRFFP